MKTRSKKKVGDSAGLEQGGTLDASAAPDGERLGPSGDFEARMELAETIMREDRDILGVLAK